MRACSAQNFSHWPHVNPESNNWQLNVLQVRSAAWVLWGGCPLVGCFITMQTGFGLRGLALACLALPCFALACLASHLNLPWLGLPWLG